MSTIEAILLGILQGLTEFLPVSSSGHLVVMQHLLQIKESTLLYDILLHMATLLATVTVFRKSVWRLCCAVFCLPNFVRHYRVDQQEAISKDPYSWMIVLIIMSTVITGCIGVLFHDYFVSAFSSLAVVSVFLFVTGVLLFVANRKKSVVTKDVVHVTLKDAVILGFVQGLAIFPGLSRSGITISTAILLKFHRSFAGEYAFLMSLPAIIGALVLETTSGSFEGSLIPLQTIFLGCVAAFVCGIVSLSLLMRWIRSGSLSYFSYYCWCMALFSMLLFFHL